MATKINQSDNSNLQSQNSISSVPNKPLPQSLTNNNLDISAATYLGGKEDDFTNAVDISVDGNFVMVGGSLKNFNLGGKETKLLGGGDGTIIRYDSRTNQAVATTRLPGKIVDLEVSKNGDIAVGYQGGIAVLNADATKVKWSKSLNNVSRIAISDGGKVGVVRDIQGADRAYLFDGKGEQLKEWSTNSSKRQFEDIAITDQNGGMVIATGFEQKTKILQVAFTQAWSYQGENLWKNYDFDNKDIYNQKLMADTRGQRVAIGRDGQLYSSYYVNGGTGFSIFDRDPFDLSEKLTKNRKIETDKYNTPTNVGSVKMTWYGRYDLKTGDLIKGQSLLARLNNGKGNSVDVNSITATEDGTVILAGGAGARIANRDQQTIEGKSVSDYAGFEGYIAIISPDLQKRLSWTPITDSDNAVAAVRKGKTAIVTTTDFQGGQITHNAIQDKAGGKYDGYLLVMGGNDTPPGATSLTPQTSPLPVSNNDTNNGTVEIPSDFENTADSLDISINGVTKSQEILSYGGASQNPNLIATISNKNELQLEKNGWRRLDITGYEITENTLLKFEFAGNGKAEIQGIGFDNDNIISTKADSGNFFQVDGSQNWGIDNLNDYIVGSDNGFTQYSIAVGDFFTGQFDFLTIANDHDVANPTAVGQFKNIELIG
ncbi:MAG: hypothetical protein VKN72_06850 [Nostocales cyanobacterium 94392]|nr:hypothetical protein [Nostocales cyanobacterium 94392]